MRRGWVSGSWWALVLAATACHRDARPAADRRPASASVDSTLGEPASDDEARSAARFTQAFYDWYARQGEKFEVALKASPAVFAPELLAAMRADVAAQARNRDDVVGLDWDPFLATQDPCDPYRVDRTTRRGDTILVAVTGTCADRQPRPGPDVIAEVGRFEAHWVFLDFRHAGDAGSLAQDLANLRRERAADSARARGR